jgi:hypothetical protein
MEAQRPQNLQPHEISGYLLRQLQITVKYLRNIPDAYSIELNIAFDVPQVPKSFEHLFFYH